MLPVAVLALLLVAPAAQANYRVGVGEEHLQRRIQLAKRRHRVAPCRRDRPSHRTSTVTRSNLLAYDVTTGKLKSWHPSTNGVVRALARSGDGRTIYAAGGVSRARPAVAGRRRGSCIG